MAFVVSFTDQRPIAREDDDPWTMARLEESMVRQGPWLEVETFTLDPVDTDPACPLARDFTSDQATVVPAWFRLVWLDASGDQQGTEPAFVGSAIRPTVQEVANLMPDRTTLPQSVNGENDEAGTFTADTRPSAIQVEALIDLVLDNVDPALPTNRAGHVDRAARALVILHTAILAEVTYFSHQGEVDTARIELWERLIERHTRTLTGTASTARWAIA